MKKIDQVKKGVWKKSQQAKPAGTSFEKETKRRNQKDGCVQHQQ